MHTPPDCPFSKSDTGAMVPNAQVMIDSDNPIFMVNSGASHVKLIVSCPSVTTTRSNTETWTSLTARDVEPTVTSPLANLIYAALTESENRIDGLSAAVLYDGFASSRFDEAGGSQEISAEETT